MNRSALRPTDMFIGRPALIGTSMVMGCFSRTTPSRSWASLRTVRLTLTRLHEGQL